MTVGQPTPLPIRVRPHRGETADSYLRRLAAANHLRFTDLRRYLARPQGSYGPIDPGRLAALAGRDLPGIMHALPELAPAAKPPARRYTQEDTQRSHAAKRAKYAAIRRDADNGMSSRAIERKHHVGRRTIVKALTSADPPERKKIHREPAALNGLHGHIDAIIEANPEITTAAIWERLADEHATTVAYPTLRTYVTSRRANWQGAGMPRLEWEVVIAAHRGMAAGYPENTLAAFRHSVSLGFLVIEVDLRATADGHIVIMHDETVDRTTSGSGEVGRMTLAEVRSLDAGSHAGPRFAGERVPTYQETLETLRGSGATLILDIKSGAMLDNERVVRLTEQPGAALDVIAGTRSIADLRDFKKLNPNLRALGLVPGPESGPPDPAAIEEFARAGADMIRLWPRWIFDSRDTAPGRSPLVERLHDLGKPAWATADTLYGDISPEHPREDLGELVRLGVNGIITDVPELLRDVLAAERHPERSPADAPAQAPAPRPGTSTGHSLPTRDNTAESYRLPGRNQ